MNKKSLLYILSFLAFDLVGQVVFHSKTLRPLSKAHRFIKAKDVVSELYVDKSVLELEEKRKAACEDFLDYTQTQMNTTGLLVIKDQKTQIELYARGANQKTRTKVFSVAKLLTGLTLGRLIQEKKDKLGENFLNQSVSKYLGIKRPENPLDKKGLKFSDITIKHLWTMSSGIDWCENSDCKAVDAVKIMYGKEREDPVRFTLSLPLRHKPGTYYRYSSGNYMLLQQVFKNLAKEYEENYENLPYEKVLAPLGVAQSEYSFERAGNGLYMGGSGLSLTLRPYGKIGQLILQKGKWATLDSNKGGTQQLLDPTFYKEMIKISDGIQNSPYQVQNWEGPAGGGIWLNDDSTGIPSFMPNAPRDMIYAGGQYGQFLLIFPSAQLVVVRTGGDNPHHVHWAPFSEKVLKCFSPDQIRDDYLKPKEPKTPPQTGKNLSLSDIQKHTVFSSWRALELCSCLFVSGYRDVETCDKVMPTKLNLLLGLNSHNLVKKPVVDRQNNKVIVRGKSLRFSESVATYDPNNPHLGCQVSNTRKRSERTRKLREIRRAKPQS